MSPVVVDNPILNSPFEQPSRHFEFDQDGLTGRILEGRRPSATFIPVPPPKKRGLAPQLALPGWTAERMDENPTINRIREHVTAFRATGYRGVTPITRELLEYWTSPDRERRLFFCQLEALETAIYLTELAAGQQPWIANHLREANEGKNPGLNRTAFKMATGSGKTVVMAMLIAWQALNRLANPRDKRFTDAFLIVTPGITIRDRLRVLLPNYPTNFYLERDVVTPLQLQQLNRARILITNFHTFLRRDTFEVASLTKRMLAGPDGDLDRFRETPDEMVRRVCRSLGSKRGIVVLNDEAHHCYQSAPQDTTDPDAAPEERLTADERSEVRANEEAARVWLNGLRAVQAKLGIRAIYDLSATPFFLAGSGYREGTLFPWVVSDFGLIDAIESGIVKVPRLPVADDAMSSDLPMYRDLWVRIRDRLPRKGRASEALPPDRRDLPPALEGALLSLYGNYRRAFEAWLAGGAGTPPVFIVVCQNTSISKVVFDWIAGWEKPAADGDGPATLVPGRLELLSNVARNAWVDRPNTLLIDSAQLESGEAMDPAFKHLASAEIEEFKREFLALNLGHSVEDVTDEDLLREVMNTIGKPGRLGEQVRCVVSVSMLTEGWDANTVTHILGVRAFKTQLLCEQVVGRGLRRVSYDADANGFFEPEYAEVMGVPFQFLPTTGRSGPIRQKQAYRVRALPEREHLEITFPVVTGYRYELPQERLSAEFTPESVKTLTTSEVAGRTELDPIVGRPTTATLDDLRAERRQTVAFTLARRVIENKFGDPEQAREPWLFTQVLGITQRWLDECVRLGDGTFLQMLILSALSHDAAERIYRGILRSASVGQPAIRPILRTYDPLGSTRYVDFTTTRKTLPTEKSHVDWLVEDSRWEGKVGAALERMPEVEAYVKNQGLYFKIPYSFEGSAHNYVPDMVVRIRDGDSPPLNLVLEVTGEHKKEKAAKVASAQTEWVPAVNNDGRHGRWSFLEITDPDFVESSIREHLAALHVMGAA